MTQTPTPNAQDAIDVANRHTTEEIMNSCGTQTELEPGVWVGHDQIDMEGRVYEAILVWCDLDIAWEVKYDYANSVYTAAPPFKPGWATWVPVPQEG